MAELKTKRNDGSVDEFIRSIDDPGVREDCIRISGLMEKITGAPPKMWGDSIVGFGSYHYKYASGREGDWFLTGFSPRKQTLSLYIMSGFDNAGPLMERMGKFKTGKSCLYVKRLEDIRMDVLEQLIRKSADHLRKAYP